MKRKRFLSSIMLTLLFLATVVFAANKEIRDTIVSIVTQQLGKPYISGQAGPNSFDCSGLVNFAYRKVDMEEFAYNELYAHGATAEQQYDRCQSEFISKENIKSLLPGDLIFLKDTYKAGISHVGVYAGGDVIIHASGGVNDDKSIKPVVKATLSGWITLNNNFVGGCRVPKNYWPDNDNGYIADVTANAKTVEATTPAVYKNPFQDLYDFMPKDGEFQKCAKGTLGSKFAPIYNGEYIPTETEFESVRACWPDDNSDPRRFVSILPSSVQQCIKDSLGSNFEKALADPSFRQSPESEKQLTSCPAFKEFLAKLAALEKYFQPKKTSTPANPAQQDSTPQTSQQPLPSLTTTEESDISNIEQSPYSAIIQWVDTNSSSHLQWYVIFGVSGRGNCYHAWTYGRTKEQAEAIARRFSVNFLGYFEQTLIDPWPEKEILKIAQQKQIVPQFIDFNKKDPVYENGNLCW